MFLIGLVGVSLVGYSFVRLTRHLNHAGSSYGLVGGTIGPRAGFFSGFAMLGAYVGFAIGTLALTAAFANAFIAALQPGNDNPYQVPWLVDRRRRRRDLVPAVRPRHRLLAKILLAIEGIGILSMIVLVVVIFAKGGAPTTGIDFCAFSFPAAVSASAVLSGVVAAFLSWAGFEACASMGEETDDPGRNIPRALAGTLMLTGVLFVVVMFAQVVGFGTDAGRPRRIQEFRKHVGRLGQYLRRTVVQLADHLHRDRVGVRLPPGLRRRRPAGCCTRSGATASARRRWRTSTRAPAVRAAPPGWSSPSRWWSTSSAAPLGWPDMGTGNAAINTYFLFAVAGSVCLMVCYLLVEIAAAWFVGAPKFVGVHGGKGKVPGLVLPTAGRGGDRRGAVVQRQGRRDMVCGAAARTVLVLHRIGHRHRRIGYRQAGR